MTAATGSGTTGATTTSDAQEYLAAVERELGDLPAEDRSALREDLALHLEALGAEDDVRPVAVRLGPPATYAADLRAAAGLPARSDGTAANPGLRGWLTGLAARPAVARAVPACHEVRRLSDELRPAWWVLRGYLVVLVPCLHEMDGVSDFPVPAPLDSHLLGAVLVVAAVAASVALGRRRLPRAAGVVVAALGVAIAMSALVAWDRSDVGRGALSGGGTTPVVDRAIGEHPLLSRYGPVTDVLPYAADGTPLEGVLLYDQDGRPLQVGRQEWWADGCLRVVDQPLAADGGPVHWSYPQSYELLDVDVDLHNGPLTPGQCDADRARPDVPLPAFAAAVD